MHEFEDVEDLIAGLEADDRHDLGIPTASGRALTAEDRWRVQNALRRLAKNPRHPGLRVEKMRGVDEICEARASRALRITFEMQDDVLILRDVGYHDATLKQP